MSQKVTTIGPKNWFQVASDCLRDSKSKNSMQKAAAKKKKDVQKEPAQQSNKTTATKKPMQGAVRPSKTDEGEHASVLVDQRVFDCVHVFGIPVHETVMELEWNTKIKTSRGRTYVLMYLTNNGLSSKPHKQQANEQQIQRVRKRTLAVRNTCQRKYGFAPMARFDDQIGTSQRSHRVGGT